MSKTVNKVVSIAIIAAMMLTVLLSTGCVKKPAGAKPGFVVYYTNYSLMIDSDISGIEQV